MGNKSKRIPFKLQGRKVMIVDRATDNFMIRHVQTSGDLRACVCGTGYSCEKHDKVDGRGKPPPQVTRKMRNSRIEWVPWSRRREASRFPVNMAVQFVKTLRNAGVKAVTRKIPTTW